MRKWIAGYLGAAVTMAAIDAVWLTSMVDRLYRPVIGSIMAEKPDMVAAVIFYLMYIGGICFLAIAPALKEKSWTRALINGAVLGLIAYGTYDLTNQATLAVWSSKLTIIDMIWGTTLTGLTATMGYLAARRAEGRRG